MRIAIIDPVGKKAGLDHYDLSLAKTLVNEGFDLRVYSNFDDGNLAEHTFSFVFSDRISGIIRLARQYISTLRKSRKAGAQVVILHLFHSRFADYFFLRLARHFNFDICLIVHDPQSLLDKKGKSWVGECISKCRYVIVHNEYSLAELSAKISVENKKKLHVIPHGNFIDLPGKGERNISIKKFGLDTNKRYLLFFGMLKKSKGLEVLLEAMKNVNPDADLIIAGRVRDVSLDWLESSIIKLNLKDRVHPIIRYITNEEREALFGAADMVVLPYHQVYQSAVMLLAMSWGVPVIASDVESNRSIIDDTNGLVFKTGDATDLSSQVNTLLKDEKKRKSIADGALNYVRKNHDWKTIGMEFKNVLENE